MLSSDKSGDPVPSRSRPSLRSAFSIAVASTGKQAIDRDEKDAAIRFLARPKLKASADERKLVSGGGVVAVADRVVIGRFI